MVWKSGILLYMMKAVTGAVIELVNVDCALRAWHPNTQKSRKNAFHPPPLQLHYQKDKIIQYSINISFLVRHLGGFMELVGT